MAKDRKPKVPKIDIPKVDLKTFLIQNMKIDPFWDDILVGPNRNKRLIRSKPE